MSTMKTMMMLLMLVLLFLLAEVGKAYRLQPLKEVSPQDVAEGVAAPSMGPEVGNSKAPAHKPHGVLEIRSSLGPRGLTQKVWQIPAEVAAHRLLQANAHSSTYGNLDERHGSLIP